MGEFNSKTRSMCKGDLIFTEGVSLKDNPRILVSGKGKKYGRGEKGG